MRQKIMSSCNQLSIHDDFLDDEELAEQDQSALRFEVVNQFFKTLVPLYPKSTVSVGDLSRREYELFERHDMISAVDLCYKMLESCCCEDDEQKDDISDDIKIVRQVMQHIHDHRVPPEFVPGFLILIVKYHFYN